MSHDAARIQVGHRVVYGERRGTVMFVGSLESVGQSGIWAGIEWDEDHYTGLHDGVVKNVRFFHARQRSSSFILASKVKCGISVRQAINEKYGTPAEMDVGVRFGTKDVVAVGWDKIMKKVSNFDQLSHVDLTGLNVNDSDTDLASIVPNVQTLVLSKSLISDWSSILSMIRPLSRLETLDLSFNRLKADTAEQNCTVRRVILRRNALQWNDLLGILPLFPSLEELFLAENHITNITRVAEKVVSKLSVLDLDSQLQKFCDWSEACDLGKIGSLRTLQLSSNHFSSLKFPQLEEDEFGKSTLFSSLTQLTIKLNEINDWKSVSELNKLRSLENLKFAGNPILQSVSPETARQWVIARIAGLKILNQTSITPKERRDAELDYLRHFGSDWLKASSELPGDLFRMEAFLKENPRFPELIRRYGPLESWEVQSVISKSLKDNVIRVTIQFLDRKQEKTLPMSISVMKLKRLVERLFRIPEAAKLAYVTPRVPDIQFILDDDQKEIAHYDVKSGDLILINS